MKSIATLLSCLVLAAAPLASAATDLDLLKKAHKGDVVAMRKIGYMKFHGKGTKLDRKNGLAWLKKAAEEDDAPSLYYLGCIYEKGTYVGQDKKKAQDYFSEAADKGYAKAKNKLAAAEKEVDKEDDMPEEVSVEKQKKSDTRVAHEDEEDSDDQNSQAEKYYEAGCQYEKQGNKQLAIDNYLEAAKLGHAESIYIIGRFYFYDLGKIEKGISALIDAAKKKHVKAAFALGQACCAGHLPVGLLMEDEEFGFALIMNNDSRLRDEYEDMSSAIRFIQMAANGGDARAQALMGLFYASGDGVPKDAEKAKEWYKKSAEQGYKYAEKALADLEHTESEDEDEESAENQETSSTHPAHEDEEDSDDQNSQAEKYYEAGCQYEKQGNKRLAIENYLEAAKLGHAESIYIIGRFYFYDLGKIREGISALIDAAEKKHVKAAFALGQVCGAGHLPVGLLMEDEEFGFALIMNNDSRLRDEYENMRFAIGLIQMAANGGDARAQALMGFFYEKGDGVPKDAEKAKEWYKKSADQGYEYAIKALKK